MYFLILLLRPSSDLVDSLVGTELTLVVYCQLSGGIPPILILLCGSDLGTHDILLRQSPGSLVASELTSSSFIVLLHVLPFLMNHWFTPKSGSIP